MVTECPLLFYGKLVQEIAGEVLVCTVGMRDYLDALTLSAYQNYSTYVTMIHRRYERLQHKCSPFLQVLHKRTKCLVYKRIETDALTVKGFNSENKAGRRSLVRWPIQLIGSMTKISTLD